MGDPTAKWDPVCWCECHADGTEDHDDCCFRTAARQRDRLADVIRRAAPLAWVAGDDGQGAADWEREADKALDWEVE